MKHITKYLLLFAAIMTVSTQSMIAKSYDKFPGAPGMGAAFSVGTGVPYGTFGASFAGRVGENGIGVGAELGAGYRTLTGTDDKCLHLAAGLKLHLTYVFLAAHYGVIAAKFAPSSNENQRWVMSGITKDYGPSFQVGTDFWWDGFYLSISGGYSYAPDTKQWIPTWTFGIGFGRGL
jgi:hypothetical protein